MNLVILASFTMTQFSAWAQGAEDEKLANGTWSQSSGEANVQPIGDYYDCCRPACASTFAHAHTNAFTCEKTGSTHVDFPWGHPSVCKAPTVGDSEALCLTDAMPKIKGNSLYAYASYIADEDDPHAQCGTCRTVKLQTTGQEVVDTLHLKLINHKPKGAGGAIDGYRLSIPGAGSGANPMGCVAAHPELYRPDVCGTDGKAKNNVCQQYGGLMTQDACEHLERSAEIDACKRIHIALLRSENLYKRDKGHIMVMSDQEDVNCEAFRSTMSVILT